jgi:hypothetical protein
MSDNFQVPSRAAAVTPSDTTEIYASALYIGGAGNVAVVTEGGDTVVFSGVQAGSMLVLRIKQVRSTSTTATNIVRLW